MDIYGIVEDINLTTTIIKTWDWKRFVVPNSKMLDTDFINYTLTDKVQMAYIEFQVAYNNDITEIEKIALKCAAESEYISSNEKPAFWVMSTDEKSIKCWLAG